MNRSLAATAAASFLALGAQAAFADTGAAGAPATTAAAPATAVTASQAAQAATAMPMTIISTRTRHTARIPGTFAIAGADASHTREAQELADGIRVMLPPLSGDGGG
jgi:hypothetical protein